MPVSLAVCETANVVNAALRESLGVGSGCAAAVNGSRDRDRDRDESKAAGSNGNGNDENLQSQIVANAKRVLLAKIEYEEVDNYRESVLDNLKSKYVVIKPNSNNNNSNSNTNGAAAANCNGGFNNSNNNKNSNGNNNGGKIVGANGHDNNNGVNGNRNNSNNNNNNNNGNNKNGANGDQLNPNELPKPKRVLYPRENLRIGWKQSERKWQVGSGLLNVGNTCYLNSTLQALFHIPALANWLVSESAHMENCSIAAEASGQCCTICAMAKTLLATQSNASAVRPFHIYSKLKQICKHMVVGRQEDAHEFLRFLVEAMEKAYLMRYRNYKELDQLVKETTPLNQIFGGYLRSAVRCLSCNHVSITFQHFQDLLLDIRKADSLEDAFDGYFARERLEDMGYKCEGCKKKVSATKQFSLERAPITLCIQLKRFSMIGNKLTKQITFKPRIDLSKYAARSPAAAAQPLSYRLVSLVTHLGVSQHCGHYTAIGLSEAGGYYNFDDSYVRPIAMQSVCSTNAYIMFYELDVASGNNNQRALLPAASLSQNQNGLRLTNGQTQTQIQTPTTATATATSSSSSASCAAAPVAASSPSPSPSRFIGPQLPPPSGGSLNGPSPNPNAVQATTPAANGHQKISIHFKNGSLVKHTLASPSSSPPSPQKAALQTHAQTQTQTQSQSNGPLCNGGTGKFQENAHARNSLAGAAPKGETVANGSKSSSASASNNSNSNNYLPMSSEEEEDDEDDSKNSKLVKKAVAQLPSMPKLMGPAAIATSAAVKTPLKSLVPYESASEEEELPQSQSLPQTQPQPAVLLNPNPNPNPRKRRSGADSDSGSDDQATPRAVNGNSNGNSNSHSTVNGAVNGNANFKLYSTVNSSKQKTDAIEEIFEQLTNNKNKHKNKHKSAEDSDDAEDEEEETTTAITTTTATTVAQTNGWRSQNGKAPPSPKTPPSPAVLKSKTGIWQITRNDEDEEQQEEKSQSHKNPFNKAPAPTATSTAAEGNAAKRQKLMNGGGGGGLTTQRVGNGYQSEAATANGNSAVTELLKQNHRGYGATVLTWNGKQTDLDKELLAEAREQRQRDHEDDEENEMDRGRQRKAKSAAAAAAAAAAASTASGYNPFQEVENQKRWHKTNGGSGSFPRFYQQQQQQHHRQNGGGGGSGGFQQRNNNKFKFNRFGGPGNTKFQQHRALQRHLSAGGGYTRRQQQPQQQ